jgi:flagellar biosynthetic protein FliR
MLTALLSADIYRWAVIFARIGAGAMLMPGLSSTMISMRVRLVFALILSFIMLPVLSSKLPPQPSGPLALFLLLGSEITIGIFIAIVTQILVSALDLAGTSMGFSIGLSNVFTFDPITEQQSQLITGFLNLMAVTLIFVTNTHHLMLRALIDSYELVAPGQALPTDDFAHVAVRTLGASSVMGLRMAAPLLVFSMTFNAGLGLLSRLVPQIQVFFVGLPLQIFGGMVFLAVCLPAIMLLFISQLTDGIKSFLNFG